MISFIISNLLRFIFWCIPCCVVAQAELPKLDAGKIERWELFPSKYVVPRHVDVWLPEGYTEKEKYDVLYMHDGQMLFDSTQTWNHQSWEMDYTAMTLQQNKWIRKFIIVAIWNAGKERHPEYFPAKPFFDLTSIEKDTVVAQLHRAGRTKEKFIPKSDLYLQFITEELKPFIDKKYFVHTSKEHTYIAGSSMGGLISIYALCEYPNIFGGAACLSTHWPGTFSLENNPIPQAFLKYLSYQIPIANQHKIYFDCGDQTLDALYPVIQKQVDDIMRGKKFSPQHWITKYFPGEEHSERSWRKRVEIPLQFLFSMD